MMIGRELDDRGITDPAAIGAALGMPAGKATKLLRPDLNSTGLQVIDIKRGNEIQPCLWCQMPTSAIQPPLTP